MNKRKLLIVDDNIMTRQHILSVAQNMDFYVEEAENAVEAIEALKKGIVFDVVIGDIRTSGASGIEFLKSLKGNSPPPVIMLATIDGSVVISKEFVTGGAFEYLTKSLAATSIEKTVDTVVYQKHLSEKSQEELAKTPKVLVLENNTSCRNIIENAIKEIGYDIVAAPNETETSSLIKQGGFEMLVVNSRFPDKDGVIPLIPMKANGSDVIVIFVTDSPDIDMAVQVIKRGAYDFIPKPLDAERLKASVRTAWEKKRHDLQERLLLLLYEEIKKNTITDTLTGLRNGSYATMRLEEEIKRVKRGDYDTFAIVIGDIDNFRMINDKAGRHIGDVVLQQIGIIIKETVRKTDIASRTDGDEFTMILPGADC
ncbi:MAG: response regulator [Planctomycetes bacterium]|nr:response regulator [Planctomycetota bacterium]